MKPQKFIVKAGQAAVLPTDGDSSVGELDPFTTGNKAGLTEARDHLALGEVSPGLPAPLLAWRLDDFVRVTVGEEHVDLQYVGFDGTFVIRDGLLASFTPSTDDERHRLLQEAVDEDVSGPEGE